MRSIGFCLFWFLIAGMLHAQNLSVHLTEEIVIGASENAAEEYLFQYSTFLRSDSKMNIYIAEAISKKSGF